MQDPIQENIEGSKQVVHTYEHRIDWGYVIVGIAVLILAYAILRVFSDTKEDESDEEVFGD